MKKIVFLMVVALVTLACEKQDQDLNNLSAVNETLAEPGVKSSGTTESDVELVVINPVKTEESKSEQGDQ